MKGRVALVTGASRNIGRAISLELARRGCDVAVLGGSDLVSAEEVATEIRSVGVRACAIVGDVSDPTRVDAMVSEVRDRLGPVSILVNNAAIRPTSTFTDLTNEEWHRVIAVNLHGPYYLCKAVVPGMIEMGAGNIVNVSGTVAYNGGTKIHPTAAAKAGLQGLTRSLAAELGPHGIRVNTIVLASIETVRRLPAASRQIPMEELPLRRKGTVDEVAKACAFLVSDDAAFVTGQSLHVNGGRLMAS